MCTSPCVCAHLSLFVSSEAFQQLGDTKWHQPLVYAAGCLHGGCACLFKELEHPSKCASMLLFLCCSGMTMSVHVYGPVGRWSCCVLLIGFQASLMHSRGAWGIVCVKTHNTLLEVLQDYVQYLLGCRLGSTTCVMGAS